MDGEDCSYPRRDPSSVPFGRDRLPARTCPAQPRKASPRARPPERVSEPGAVVSDVYLPGAHDARRVPRCKRVHLSSDRVTNPIVTGDILNLDEYEKTRLDMRTQVVALRHLRRVPVGNRISFEFENRETVLFQICETMRTEGITNETALAVECAVHSALLPTTQELSATLAFDLPEGANVREELRRLNGLDERTVLVVGVETVRASFEVVTKQGTIVRNQHVRFRLSAAARRNFLDVETSVLLKIDHPSYKAQAAIDGNQRRALIQDLL